MRGRIIVASAVSALALFGTASAVGAARGSDGETGGRPFHATLLGTNENLPVVGDPDATGEANVTLNSGQGTVCWDITVDNVSEVILAHIHVGTADVNGPVVVDFNEPVNGLNGCVQSDPALIKEIRTNPAGYYVNVHTVDHTGGAARGQLGT